MRFEHHGWNADHAIAIQVLVEAGLQRFQCGAGSRHDADGVRDAVAAAVGIPHRVLIGARVLPGHFVAACRLLRAVRSPRPPNWPATTAAPLYFNSGPVPLV